MIIPALVAVFVFSACDTRPPDSTEKTINEHETGGFMLDAREIQSAAFAGKTISEYKTSDITETASREHVVTNDYWEVVEHGKNYRIVQIYEHLPWYYRYELLDNNDEVVFYFVTSRAAWIRRVSEDVIKLSVGVGTNVRWSKFYSIQLDVLSESFQNAELLECGNIAFISRYGDEWKVVVRDIFNEEVPLREVLFDTFSPGALVTTSTQIVCMGDGTIMIDSLRCVNDFGRSVVFYMGDTHSMIFELLVYQNQSRKITIRDSESGYTIQEIFPYEYTFFGYPTKWIRVEDMNFDGYVDIGLVEFLPASPNIPYVWWVWNSEMGQFIHCEMLSALTSPIVDRENELIRTDVRISAARHVTRQYRYINGELRLVDAVYTSYTD